MKKNIAVKVFAFLALFGIIISVVGTGIMILVGDTNVVQEEQVFTQEDFQKLIDEGKININNSGSVELVNTGSITSTGEIEK